MPDLFVDVDTAVVVPVNKLPLLDDTDFKTLETAIAYNAAGMALKWNFVTPAGAVTQTAVTPTTAGDYDWAHSGGAMYTIEIPASGGASINNDTEGTGWFTGLVTGVLPFCGPTIGFRAAALNDLFIDGTDLSTMVANMRRWANTLGYGTVDTGATAHSIPCSSIFPAIAVVEQFVGRTLVFENDTTTVNLRGASFIIDSVDTTGNTIYIAGKMPAIPVSGDKFSMER